MDYKQCEKDFWEMFKKLPPIEKVKVYSRMKQANDFWERLHSVNPNKLYITSTNGAFSCKEVFNTERDKK